MKGTNAIFGFKKMIRFLVTIFASREFGFIYCLIGTITQIAHTYFLTYEISSLEGNWKVAQAVMLSAFISSSLLYFVVISDNEKTRESRRVHFAINILMFIEILINLYYYSRHLIIDSPQLEIFDFVFAILVSCLIPVMIKLYAGLIQAKTWFDEFKEDKEHELQKVSTVNPDEIRDMVVDSIKTIDPEIVKEMMSGYMENMTTTSVDENAVREIVTNTVSSMNLQGQEPTNEKIRALVVDEFSKTLNEYKGNLDKQVADAFSRNSEMFLQQFENKLKMLLNQYKDKKASGMV